MSILFLGLTGLDYPIKEFQENGDRQIDPKQKYLQIPGAAVLEQPVKQVIPNRHDDHEREQTGYYFCSFHLT